MWRALSAAADTLVIFLVFLIGLRLHNKWVGVTAAILYAAAVLPIQIAHFGTADAITTLFVTLAIFFAVRTQDSGGLWDYAAFGVALGMAVASRVNVAPLAGVIVVVALLRTIPAFDSRLIARERDRLFLWNFAGLVLAGFMSLLAFRLFNPYAFSGPGFFGILPDSRYLITLGQAQTMASGVNDWPPNWQWANRTPFLYAWQNMVLWGMGVGFGLSGWLAWVWTGWRLLRGRPGATRNLVPFVWVLGYFGFIGGIWVMSMRYYLPLYPVLAVLAAWAIVELVRRAYRPGMALWRRVGASGLAVGVVAFTVLWALMFTNIYRSMSTFTQSGHWTWENVPGDFYMRIDGADDSVPLINIPIWNRPVPETTPIDEYIVRQSSQIVPGRDEVVTFMSPVSGTVSTVYGHRVGSADDDGSDKTLTIAITSTRDDELRATASLTDTFPRGGDEHILGREYALELDQPLELQAGERYTFTVTVGGGPLLTSGAVMLNEPW